MHFEYPGASVGTPVAWEISLLGHGDSVLRRWTGSTAMKHREAQVRVDWDGRDGLARPLPAGYYTVRLRAIALDDANAHRIGTGIATHALRLASQLAPRQIEEQRVDIQVGAVTATPVPAFSRLPTHGARRRLHRSA